MPEKSQLSHSVKARWHNGLAKRLLVVAGIVGTLAAVVMIVDYATTPDIRFALKKFDCSAAAITSRNEASGKTTEDACIIDIAVTNLEHEDVTLDIGEMSGPGPADFGGESLIRIYDANGKFCYGYATYLDLVADESKDVSLTCVLDDRHSEVNDLSIDAQAAYIVIDYKRSKTRITLTQ
jgi:hypothetical protein